MKEQKNEGNYQLPVRESPCSASQACWQESCDPRNEPELGGERMGRHGAYPQNPHSAVPLDWQSV